MLKGTLRLENNTGYKKIEVEKYIMKSEEIRDGQ